VSAAPAIRHALPADLPAVEDLYAAAFPREDLRPLVRELSAMESGILLLVALRDGGLVGHAAFTRCGIAGGGEDVALLGPLAVAPALQRQGIGRVLIEAGLEQLRRDGVRRVQVLGDPAYYGRVGFAPDDGLLPPYPLHPGWQGAWQSRLLDPGGASLRGTLVVPPAWRQPALWAP
jgi:putative acetyltransferase